jgi:hypothetical protein
LPVGVVGVGVGLHRELGQGGRRPAS